MAAIHTYYEFGDDPMKMCSKHKLRMKVDPKIKDIRIVYNCVFIT
jgi:hypothetical protein